MKLKKGCTFLLCLLVFFSPLLSYARADEQDDATGTTITGKNWTSLLPDGYTLDAINIPGTHDSGTKGMFFGECQDTTIRQQLDMGCRFLDIRLWYTFGRLRVVHGAFNTDLYLRPNILEVCFDFIKENPNEFIVMSLKEDYGSAQFFDRHVYEELRDAARDIGKTISDCFFLEDRMPALSEIRGKIVIMRRYANKNEDTYRIGINARDGWGDDTYSTIPRTGYTIEVQDCYKFRGGTGDEGKMSCWMKEFDKAETKEDPYKRGGAARPHTLWINFASGNVAGSFMEGIARYVNPRIRACFLKLYDSGYVRGIIPMDFVSEPVVRAIYKSNDFTVAQPQPAPMVYAEARDSNSNVRLQILDEKAYTRFEYREVSAVGGPWIGWTDSSLPLEKGHTYEIRLKATNNTPAGPSVTYTVAGHYTSQDYIQLNNTDNKGKDISLPAGCEYIVDQDKINASIIIYGGYDVLHPTIRAKMYLTGEQGNVQEAKQDLSPFQIKSVSHFNQWIYAPFSASGDMKFSLPDSECITIEIAPYIVPGRYFGAGEHAGYLEMETSGPNIKDLDVTDHKYTVPLRIDIDEADLNTAGIDVTIEPQKSRGTEPIEPPVTVTMTNSNIKTSDNKMELIEGKDYTVDFYCNTSPGEAWAVLTGIHNFESLIVEPFLISGYQATLDANGDNATINGVRSLTLPNLGVVPDLKEYVPVRPGYVSTGWYWDAQCTKKASTGEALGADTILYAGWSLDPDVGENGNNVPRTGDSSHPLLWLGVACLSMTGLLLTRRKRKTR